MINKIKKINTFLKEQYQVKAYDILIFVGIVIVLWVIKPYFFNEVNRTIYSLATTFIPLIITRLIVIVRTSITGRK